MRFDMPNGLDSNPTISADEKTTTFSKAETQDILPETTS
jgi:hypothetical protein